MAIDNFKPSLWETAIIEAYKGLSVADAITVAPTSVNGKEAIFNRLVPVEGVKDYAALEGDIEYDGIDTTKTSLFFDQQRYFAYQIEDVDKVQLAGDVMMPMAREMAYALKKDVDNAVLSAADAEAADMGSISIANPEEAYNTIVNLGTALDELDIPENERVVICRPEFVNVLAKDVRIIDNANVLANGIVQGMQVNGMQVIKTTHCPKGKVIALHKSAIGYGKQLEKMEALRLQGRFSDAVRGLMVYGVKVLRPECLVKVAYTIGE